VGLLMNHFADETTQYQEKQEWLESFIKKKEQKEYLV
jgi:hypothetical protein